MKTAAKCLTIVMVLVSVLGCARPGERREISTFVLAIDRPQLAPAAQIEGTLEIQNVSINRLFSGRELVYRTGRYEFQSDPTNVFLIMPAEMVTEKLRNWLSEAEIFTRVIGPGRMVPSDYIMETHINSIYGDFALDPAAAVVEVEIFLLRRGRVLFEQTYHSNVPLRKRTPEALFNSYEIALNEIFTQLEQDLASFAANI